MKRFIIILTLFSSLIFADPLPKLHIQVNNHSLTATLVDNSSTKALVELLQNGPITIDAHDYGNFEKVGELPTALPRNDENITTESGDIILYLGKSLVFYYSDNTWDFTRIGKVDGSDALDLKKIYGDENATFVIFIESTNGISKNSKKTRKTSHSSLGVSFSRTVAHNDRNIKGEVFQR